MIRYSRTLAALALLACHLADLKDEYSVNFDQTHKLSEIVTPLAAAVMEAHQSAMTQQLLTQLFEAMIQYRGTLSAALEDQYIVFHFFALKNLRSDGGFPPPIDTTQSLAHLKWCFRLVMFNRLRSALQDERRRCKESGDTVRLDEEKLIKDTLWPLRVGHATEMGTILSIKGILRLHAEQRSRPPMARWDDLDFTRLYCQGKQFSLGTFRTMNEKLLSRGESLLSELLMEEKEKDWLSIPDYIHDDEGKSGDLYTFLLDSRNCFHYLDSPFALHMMQRFSAGVVNGRLQTKGIQEYLSRCRALLDLIAAMMHLTGGGAPRAQEAIQTRILEGKEGKRNVFWMRGKIGWILQYNKSKGQKVCGF